MKVTRSKASAARSQSTLRVAGRLDDVRGNHRAVAGDGHADLDVRVVAGRVVRRHPGLLINAFDDLRIIRVRHAAVAGHVNRAWREDEFVSMAQRGAAMPSPAACCFAASRICRRCEAFRHGRVTTGCRIDLILCVLAWPVSPAWSSGDGFGRLRLEKFFHAFSKRRRRLGRRRDHRLRRRRRGRRCRLRRRDNRRGAGGGGALCTPLLKRRQSGWPESCRAPACRPALAAALKNAGPTNKITSSSR